MRGFCARTAASTTVSTTEGSFTSTTITTSTSNKLAKGVDDDSDEEMEPAGSPDEESNGPFGDLDVEDITVEQIQLNR